MFCTLARHYKGQYAGKKDDRIYLNPQRNQRINYDRGRDTQQASCLYHPDPAEEQDRAGSRQASGQITKQTAGTSQFGDRPMTPLTKSAITKEGASLSGQRAI
ncbi:hypothetical protein ILYODFUR_022915 [Ilyodon furcidens]|uniref:Uncharacterized protein n=1 Tax=Ilyodon furcidens TaxID=33524 RepID=A0ABV0TY42_9TELE